MIKKFILLFLVVIAMASIATAQEPASKKKHVSRQVALNYLRHEGILWGKTKVISAQWYKDTNSWLILLRQPGCKMSHWFVNSTATDYSGSTCSH